MALLATAVILVAQATRMPALSDPTGVTLPSNWALHTPTLTALLAPLTTLWDGVSMLSRSRLSGFLLGLGLIYLGWRTIVRLRRPVAVMAAVGREAVVAMSTLAWFVAFVAVGLAWNTRPSVRLAGLHADDLTVEVHAHTNASHDVRSWPVAEFDAAASLAWHRRAGVDLVFITDHNTTRGWNLALAGSQRGESWLCPGVEVSAHGAHVVVLGQPLPADSAGYRGGPERRAALFREIAAAPQAVAIASLPEYRGQVAEFIAEGVHGFEIVNASPKGNAFPRTERDSVIAAARRHGLALVGTGDQHGYGATPMAWNVMRLPGWRMRSDPPCATIVAALRSGGPDAVRIVERARVRVDSPLPLFLTPVGVLWVAWATMSPGSVLAWLVWIWGGAMARRSVLEFLRRRRTAAIMTTVAQFR